MAKISPNEINQAFESNRFETVFQPKVSLKGEPILLGAEAFVRMRDAEGRSFLPVDFLSQINEMGKTMELMLVVMTQVCQTWQMWKEQGLALQLAMNLDQTLLVDKKLAGKLAELSDNLKVPRKYLTYEISNSQSEITELEVEQITRLRMKGFRVAIDDCGQSVLKSEQILNLPIDELKLHRAITQQLPNQYQSREVARQILGIANKIGIPVIAVGIELPEQANWLVREGYDAAEGYLYSPPLPAASLGLFMLEQGQWQLQADGKPNYVLLASENEEILASLEDAMGDKYSVLRGNDSQSISAQMKEFRADVVIIDTNIESGHGMEICHSLLKENSEQNSEQSLSVLLLADSLTESDKLRAYDNGVSDILPTDCSAVEISAKVDRLKRLSDKRKAFADEVQNIQKTALGSMQEAAHYGDVVQFFKDIISCGDEIALAQRIVQFLSSKELSGSVQFKGADRMVSYNKSLNNCSPMEENIFEILADKGRVFEFKDRIIFNDKHVSILVNKLPKDEEIRGRIRDYVAVVIEGIEARYLEILMRRTLHTAFEKLTSMASDLQSQHQMDQARKKQMLEKFHLDLQMSYHVLDLTEEQENHFNQIIDRMLDTNEEAELVADATQQQIQHLANSLSIAMVDLDDAKEEPSPIVTDSIELF